MKLFSHYEGNEHFVNLTEIHPHIAEKIKIFWGQPEMRQYLIDIMLDSRDGARRGFHDPASKAIMFFLNEHDIHFPQYVEENISPWRNF